MSASSSNELNISPFPLPSRAVIECSRCMELVNLGDEEYVFNVDKQEHTTTVFHWTCWLDGLSDIIFHSIINRLSREISLKQGFDVELRDSLR